MFSPRPPLPLRPPPLALLLLLLPISGVTTFAVAAASFSISPQLAVTPFAPVGRGPSAVSKSSYESISACTRRRESVSSEARCSFTSASARSYAEAIMWDASVSIACATWLLYLRLPSSVPLGILYTSGPI